LQRFTYSNRRLSALRGVQALTGAASGQFLSRKPRIRSPKLTAPKYAGLTPSFVLQRSFHLGHASPDKGFVDIHLSALGATRNIRVEPMIHVKKGGFLFFQFDLTAKAN
jgi:hypothetical protein